MKILIELETLQYKTEEQLLADGARLIAIGMGLQRRNVPHTQWTYLPTPTAPSQEDSEVKLESEAVSSPPLGTQLDIVRGELRSETEAVDAPASSAVSIAEKEPKPRGRPKADKESGKLAQADIKAAQKAAIQEAIQSMTQPAPAGLPSPQYNPILPVTEAPELPQPPAIVQPLSALLGSLPAPQQHALPGSLPQPSAAQPQSPASTGPASSMPVIPADGASMSLDDFIAVVRLSAPHGASIAFEVMRKHGVSDGYQTPEHLRAQIAREIAERANLKG